MTTKIPAELSSTPGISDSSNATAITITSDEDFLVRQTSADVYDTNSGSTKREFWGNQFSGSNNTASKTIIGSASNLPLVGGSTQNASSKFIVNSYIGFGSSDQTAGGEDGFMAFYTSSGGAAGTEKMRIDSSGNLGIGYSSPSDNIHILGNDSTPNVGITLQTDDTANAQASITLMSRNSANTNVSATLKNVTTALQSSLGITFGSDTAAQNALDDYEEGTWTPSLPEGGTVNTNYGSYYTKIGRQVIAYFYITITPTNNNQQFKIGNLPFTCINQSGYYPSGSLGYSSNKDLSFLYPPLVMINDTYAYFHYNNGNANFVDNATMQRSGGLPIIGQVIYNAA
jgi:hypothetical protein